MKKVKTKKNKKKKKNEEFKKKRKYFKFLQETNTLHICIFVFGKEN